MTSLQPKPRDVDPKLIRDAMALYSSPGSLLGKLQVIWQVSDEAIPEVEARRSKEIKKVEAKLASIASAAHVPLSERIALAKRNGLFPKNYTGVLLEAYFGTLAMRQEIQSTFMGLVREPGSSRSVSDLFSSDNLMDRNYLDKVVPLFFALQLHCVGLLAYVNAEKHTTADAKTRSANARKGGMAKSELEHGRDELYADVIKCLASLKVSSFKSLPELFVPPSGPLLAVLDKYQSCIGSNSEVDGRVITYGETLDAGSLERQVRKWAGTDTELRHQLERVCRSYQKK